MSPAPTGMIVEAIKFQCRRIYQNYKLPDPLAFSHPEGEFVDVPIEEFFQDGPELKQFQERGMLLNSVTHCPGESGHSEVWYASQLALLIIRHELILAIIRDIERRVDEGRAVSSERLVGLANDLFKNGHDTGTMHKEYLMKFEFEEDALSNQKRRKSAVDNNKKRSRVSFERNRAALSRMARLSEDKVHGISATRKVVSEGLYSGKPDSLRKLYESWLKKSKNHHQKTQK
jgi:hypothetical protein